METILVKTPDGEPMEKTVEKIDLETMYRLIGCDTVDVVSMTDEKTGTSVDIWYDEEFLLRNKPEKPNLLLPEWRNGIRGNILFCAVNKKGESVGLTKKEKRYALDICERSEKFKGLVTKNEGMCGGWME